MADNRNAENHKKLLIKFSDFSKNMTQNHHLENLSEFVLHDVCALDQFQVPKAAYLVNNPDFTRLKGVAGYHNQESFKHGDLWSNQKAFTDHMKNANFNQKVRLVEDKSLILQGINPDRSRIFGIADQLEINDPVYHTWKMKHDNQGVLIFEKPQDFDMGEDHFLQFLYMLSFCPIF